MALPHPPNLGTAVHGHGFPPIAAFCGCGIRALDHQHLIPSGILLRDKPEAPQAAGSNVGELVNLTWGGFPRDHFLPVTIGNLIACGLMVAAIYWLNYLRPDPMNADTQIESQRQV